MTVFKKTYSHG